MHGLFFRAIRVEQKTSQLISHEELQEMWVLLEKSAPEYPDSNEIDYKNFVEISKMVGPKAK